MKLSTETELERYRRIARAASGDPAFGHCVAFLKLALHERNTSDTLGRRAFVGELIVGMRARARETAPHDVPAQEIDDFCGAALVAALEAVVLMPFHGGVA